MGSNSDEAVKITNLSFDTFDTLTYEMVCTLDNHALPPGPLYGNVKSLFLFMLLALHEFSRNFLNIKILTYALHCICEVCPAGQN